MNAIEIPTLKLQISCVSSLLDMAYKFDETTSYVCAGHRQESLSPMVPIARLNEIAQSARATRGIITTALSNAVAELAQSLSETDFSDEIKRIDALFSEGSESNLLRAKLDLNSLLNKVRTYLEDIELAAMPQKRYRVVYSGQFHEVDAPTNIIARKKVAEKVLGRTIHEINPNQLRFFSVEEIS
ncbi:hypothetical protein GC174_15230 [bacterium]|nr:hypothetical protein [bacterium]